MPNAESPEFPGTLVQFSGELPVDIATHRTRLVAARMSAADFGRYMDGYVFGMVGADAVVGLVPVVGEMFSGVMTCWLLAKATQVRMPLGDRLVMAGLGAIDVAIGMVPGAGDATDFIFRSHIWSARRLVAHIDMQIAQIDAVGPLPGDHPQLEQLRDALFRGGKTRQEVWRRLIMIGTLCALALGYCSYEVNQAAQRRHERVMACEARGGWFCGW